MSVQWPHFQVVKFMKKLLAEKDERLKDKDDFLEAFVKLKEENYEIAKKLIRDKEEKITELNTALNGVKGNLYPR